jgi:hypothetical protein
VKTPKSTNSDEESGELVVLDDDVPEKSSPKRKTPRKAVTPVKTKDAVVDEIYDSPPPKLSLRRRRARNRIVSGESTPGSQQTNSGHEAEKNELPKGPLLSPQPEVEESGRRRSTRLASRVATAALSSLSSPGKSLSPSSSPSPARKEKAKTKNKDSGGGESKVVKKIAPLFLPKQKKQKVEKEVKPLWTDEQLAARKNFLSSGLPQEVVKMAAKASEKA